MKINRLYSTLIALSVGLSSCRSLEDPRAYDSNSILGEYAKMLDDANENPSDSFARPEEFGDLVREENIFP